MRMAILAVPVALSIGLANEAIAIQRRAAIPPDVTYRIVGEETIPHVKRSVDVRIDRRVSEDVLRTIAHEIRTKDRNSYERTFILYYLPGMEIGAGAWASTHFNPDLEIQIYGATEEEHAALLQSPDSALGRQVIGLWLDELISRRIILYREDGKLLMESTFRDGSVGTYEMTERTTSRGLRFDHKNRLPSGDYYVLNRSGDLEIRDSDGLITIARKIGSN